MVKPKRKGKVCLKIVEEDVEQKQDIKIAYTEEPNPEYTEERRETTDKEED